MTTPVQLGQVTGLPDVLTLDHFSLRIANLPGGGDGQSLEILNMTAVLPGRSNNVIKTELHKHSHHQAGKMVMPYSFQASFVDTAQRKVITALKNWQARQTDPATGLGRPRSDYTTTAVVSIFGADNSIVEQRTFYNMWVAAVQDISLNGQQNSALQVNVTFQYDYWL